MYRIIKITFDNNSSWYYIQKQKRVFGIGPKVWKYYEDVYDGNHCSHVGWTYIRKFAEKYIDDIHAEGALKNIIGLNKANNVKNIEVIHEYTYESSNRKRTL